MTTTPAATAFTWIFILLPLLIIWGIGLYDIFRRPLPRQTKAAWALIVVLLPVIGTIGYFLLRKPSEEELRLTMEARQEARRGGPRV
ncbi:MAG: PLDc_N domain-containing protein [Thermoleophilaceae bacterium]|nr:PLDc_N domain-containing protein [Thermoleophilaceae bacterium]